ncbi:MAG: hypothetical protein IPJ65_36945 [Archangiaceae bacterium]|nr:hypothetical protein [Archangiaceae bacterium]
MAVRLSTVLQYSKGNEKVAASLADNKRTQALVDPKAAAALDLSPDEFERVKARRASFEQAAGKVAARANIVGLWTEHQRGGLPFFRWQGQGDRENFFMAVHVADGDRSSVTPELWTNLNHNANPADFEAWPMELVSQNGDTLIFKASLPIERQGNFRVTGRIATNGKADAPNWQWAEQSGIGDVRFKPRAVANEKLSEQVVHVGLANCGPGEAISTFRDLMDPTWGKYNIQAVKAAGKNTIRLQPPFKADRWDRAHPYDTLGSPYAATDFFTIDPRYSRDAQALPEDDVEGRRKAANAEFFEFVAEARRQGVEVVLDIALNHTGHNTTIRDLFDDPALGERVLKSNFDQLTISPDQTAAVHQRLQSNPLAPGEALFPEMFASREKDPAGAHSISDTVGGGGGQWADTKQLNHGGFDFGGQIFDTPQNRSVTDWFTRVLKFWVDPPAEETGGVKMQGVRGFRLDHGTNLPNEFYERSMNQLFAMVDQPVVFIDEDFNQGERLRVWTDAMESGWYKNLVDGFKRSDLGAINGIVFNDYFYETLRGGNHDEERIINLFEGDTMAAGRYLAMLDLFGGISTTVMGDELGERREVEFKHEGAVPETLVQARENRLSPQQVDLQQAMFRAGRAKNTDPSLATVLRAPLNADGFNANILAIARHADDPMVPGTLVFTNLANAAERSNNFHLDGITQSRIEPGASYQATDLMAEHPDQPLWPSAVKGSDLLANGVFVKLQPYQIQALKLEKV